MGVIRSRLSLALFQVSSRPHEGDKCVCAAKCLPMSEAGRTLTHTCLLNVFSPCFTAQACTCHKFRLIY